MSTVRSVAAAWFVGTAIVACGGGGSSGGGGGGDGGGGGGTCTGAPAAKSCESTPCGGDIVGTWKLVTFCAPSCVKSLSPSIDFGAGGDYGGGTWKYGASSNTVTTTVGNASSTASYCVQGDTLWIDRGTNCGPSDPGSIRSQWQRDCGGPTPPPVTDGGR
jgi:hypothetical protein